MYLAAPSYNPDSRIRLPIPREHHIISGERVFEKQIKKKTLEVLYELGLYDSEARSNHTPCMESFAEATSLKC
jgi:hypothetical protein